MRSPNPKRLARLAALIAVLGWFPAADAHAQPGPPAADTSADAAQPEAIAPIPLEAVPDRAEATRTEIAALVSREASRRHIAAINRDVDLLLREVAARLSSARHAIASRADIHTLQARSIELSAMQAELLPWNQELDSRLDGLRVALERADAIGALWKKTAEVAKQEGATGATAARIAALRQEVEDARNAGIEQRAQILTVRDRLVDPSTELASAIDQVQRATELRLEGILRVDRPPLWSEQVRESFGRDWRAIGPHLVNRLQESWRYATQQYRALGFQIAFFAALAWALRALRERVRDRADDDYDLRSAGQVFEHPWAMAVVLIIFFSASVHRVAPRSGAFLAVVLAAIAAMRIARQFVPPAMLPLAWGLAGFFLIDRFRDLLDATPTLNGLVFLLEMLGALGLLVWLRRPSRLAEIPGQLRQATSVRLLGAAMHAAVAILTIAIAAELAGWRDLATLIGGGLLRGGYVGLFSFALLMILQGLAAFALVMRPLRLLRSVSMHRLLVRRRVERLLTVGVVLAWVGVVSSQVGVYGPAKIAVASAMSAGFSVGALSVSVADVLAFGVTVWLSFMLARFVDFVLREDVFSRVRTGRGVPYAVSGLVRYTLIFLGFLAGLSAAGVEVTKLTVIAGGLGVGIGFGLQNIVNNFVSGLILLFERPIQVGDTIQLSDAWGAVLRIGIRASVIRTFDGAEIIVPNGMLVSDKVTNWTLSDKHRRVEVDVGVEYGTPAPRVIELLVAVAKANPNVIANPEPRAYFVRFGDSSLDFKLRVWIDGFDDGYSTRSDLTVAIQQSLADAGISVPFPQRDLHVVSVAPGTPWDPGNVDR